ncbi:MAG: PAS domain-containing protein [Thermodesulfovibrionales bacterium]
MDAIRKMTRFSVVFFSVLAVMIALLIPAGYFILGYQNQRAVFETEAHMNSVFLSEIISANPGYWRYEQFRLVESLTAHTSRRYGEMRRVIDSKDSVVAQTGGKIESPVITVSHAVYDSGVPVGRVEITGSLRPLLKYTSAVGSFSVCLGAVIFLALKAFPLRALAKAMQSAYEEKETAHAILNNIPDIAWLKDKDDRYIAANEPFGTICGVAPADLAGKTDLDLWPRDLAERYRADDREVMATGKRKYIDEPLVDKDGKTTWILTIKTPIFNDKGEAIGTIGIARDFTERKQIEDELRYKKTVLSILQQISPSALLLVDENSRITSYNQQFIDLWGLPGEMVSAGIDEPVLRVVCQRMENPEAFLAKVNYLYEHKEETSHDELQLRDGRIIDRYSSPVTGDDGRYYGRVWDFRDITELKRAVEEVRKLNEGLELRVAERTKQLLDAQEELVLKEKLSTLGQLAGSVSHELRNPLGVMSNAIYYLKTIMSGADETVKEYLNIIKSEIDISERIITDLLDFTRTRTSQTNMVAVDDLITQSIGECKVPQCISLRVEIPDTLPAVKVDPLQMGQVFQNLVTNAVQAMPNGGELCISARLADNVGGALRGSPVSGDHTGSPLQKDTDFIEISVTDTGEGISPENMKKLFQPLFTTKARGIGLGLTVVKNLTEANGGRLEVKSESGKGTAFTVILPAIVNRGGG